MTGAILLLLALLTVVQVDDPDAGSAATADATVAERLDRIRDQLVQLELEKALAALESLLADPDLLREEQLDALVLRAQTHAAIGDFGAAEADYRTILQGRPSFAPETTMTPRKALERFEAARKELIGTLRVVLDPVDASLTVDGRRRALAADGSLPVLSGERRIRAEAEGCDPEERVVNVEAGQELELRLQLLPNARSVIVRTDPGGVEVWLDGERAGTTDPVSRELLLPNVPLGDHTYELRRACYRDLRFDDLLTVDLLDRSPRVVERLALEPAVGRLQVTGKPAGASVYVDGERAGDLPLDGVTHCPGFAELAVRVAGREVWRSRAPVRQDETTVVKVEPRPNLVLVGRDDWPVGWDRFAAAFSVEVGRVLPQGDPFDPAAWRGALPERADLALAVLPPARPGAPDRWLLVSPILGHVEEVRSAPEAARPGWTRPYTGLAVADSAIGGACRVVGVGDGSPASLAGIRPGDRVAAIDAAACESAPWARERLERGGPRRLDLERRAGVRLEVELTPVDRQEIGPRSDMPVAIRAAWASTEAVSSGDAAPSWANLAWLFSRHGRGPDAIEAWKRARFPARPGVSDASVAYWLGRALKAAGREREAIEVFRRAAASAATARRDGGEPVAPAALDHLADLGAAPE